MAVVTRKALAIANDDAVPALINQPSVDHQFLRSQVGSITLTAGDSIASVLVFARVPSNARINSVRVFNTADTTLAADIGLYPAGLTNASSQAVDADFFAAALSLVTASLAGTDATHRTVFTLANAGLPLWQALGLPRDPSVMYDVALTLTAAATGAPTVAVKVDYVI